MSQESRVAQLTSRGEDVPSPPLTKDQKVLAGVGAGLVLLSFAWLFSPSSQAPVAPEPTPAPQKSRLELAYEGCLRTGMQGPSDLSLEEHEKEITSACDNLKAPCGNAEASPECELFIKEYAR